MRGVLTSVRYCMSKFTVFVKQKAKVHRLSTISSVQFDLISILKHASMRVSHEATGEDL